MTRLARPLLGVLALAAALAVGAADAVAAQVPADTVRRDSTVRGDTTARPVPGDSVPPPPVHHLTDLGAQLRPGNALYRVRVIVPHRVTADSAAAHDSAAVSARSDSLTARDSIAAHARDSLTARDPAAAPGRLPGPPIVPDTAALPVQPAARDTLAPNDGLAAGVPVGPPPPLALDTVDMGVRTTSVAATTYAGSPAWLLISAGGRGIRSSLDSLALAQADLRPLHLGGSIGQTRIAAEFTPDTVFAGTSAPTGRRSVVAAMPSDAIVSLEALDALLQVLPLQEGWSDSVHVALIAPPVIAAEPGVLTVEGSDTASTPLGPADCWVVVLRTYHAEQRLWVTKDEHLVVRAWQPLPTPGAALERVLIAWTGGTQQPPPAAAPDSVPPVPPAPPTPR